MWVDFSCEMYNMQRIFGQNFHAPTTPELLQKTMSRSLYEIEPVGESSGKCDCCRSSSQCIWGFVHGTDGTVASYFLHWTTGASLRDHPANMDLIVGKWGEGATSDDRVAVSLIHFENDAGRGVMVIDADERPIASNDLVGKALRREEVMGTTLASKTFGIFDAVLQNDPRLQ